MPDLTKSGKVTRVIDQSYIVPEVPEAIRYVEQHHAQGKLVMTMVT